MAYKIRVDAKLFYKIEFIRCVCVLQINCATQNRHIEGHRKSATNQIKRNGKLPREKHSVDSPRHFDFQKPTHKKKKDALKTFLIPWFLFVFYWCYDFWFIFLLLWISYGKLFSLTLGIFIMNPYFQCGFAFDCARWRQSSNHLYIYCVYEWLGRFR